MADKKSFIIYKDSLSILNKLNDQQAGQLFKAIKAYQLGEDYELDALIDIAFNSFHEQFKRDDANYEIQCERNRANGSKGGRPPKPTQTDINPQKPSGLSGNPKNPDKDSDKDSVSDNEKDNVKKRNHLFKNSPYFVFEIFKDQFKEKKYDGVDLKFYHEAVADWSASNGELKKDWIATARNFIRRDEKEGKIKMIQAVGSPYEHDPRIRTFPKNRP